MRAKDGKYVWKSPSTVGKWTYAQNLAGVIWGEDLINGINPGRAGEGDPKTMTMNIIYRGWGAPVRITAPPKHAISDDW